jgi:hypothetical protein
MQILEGQRSYYIRFMFLLYILGNSKNEDTDKQRSKKDIKSLTIGRKDEEKKPTFL